MSAMPEAKVDEEMKAFAADVRESIAQAKRGEVARAASGHCGALRRAQESGGDRTGQWRVVCISPQPGARPRRRQHR